MAFLFSELIQYAHRRVSHVKDLERRLQDVGYDVRRPTSFCCRLLILCASYSILFPLTRVSWICHFAWCAQSVNLFLSLLPVLH